MEKYRTSIIGTGALGAVLAEVLDHSGFPLAGLYNRHVGKAQRLRSKLGVPVAAKFPSSKDELGTLIFFTVADRQIEETARRLSVLDDDFEGYIVAHCSGVKTSSALQPLCDKGAYTASFHPLQSFAAQPCIDDFQNIYVDMEGDQYAINYLEFVCGVIGCHPLKINPEAKEYLHAAAVMASNYVGALAENAAQIAGLGDLDKKEALQALKPLLLQSAKNISSSDQLSEALSGPIVRGDVETVSAHLKLLEDHRDLRSLYITLGRTLLTVMDENKLSEKEKQPLQKLFSRNNE